METEAARRSVTKAYYEYVAGITTTKVTEVYA